MAELRARRPAPHPTARWTATRSAPRSVTAVTADFCGTLGTGLLRPIGYMPVFGATQYLAGCLWRLRQGGTTTIDVSLIAGLQSALR